MFCYSHSLSINADGQAVLCLSVGKKCDSNEWCILRHALVNIAESLIYYIVHAPGNANPPYLNSNF